MRKRTIMKNGPDGGNRRTVGRGDHDGLRTR